MAETVVILRANKSLAQINNNAYAPGMMTEQEVKREVLQRAAEIGSQKALSARIGVSEQVLSLFLSGKRRPGKWLLAALGYERVVGYRRLGKQGR